MRSKYNVKDISDFYFASRYKYVNAGLVNSLALVGVFAHLALQAD